MVCQNNSLSSKAVDFRYCNHSPQNAWANFTVNKSVLNGLESRHPIGRTMGSHMHAHTFLKVMVQQKRPSIDAGHCGRSAQGLSKSKRHGKRLRRQATKMWDKVFTGKTIKTPESSWHFDNLRFLILVVLCSKLISMLKCSYSQLNKALVVKSSWFGVHICLASFQRREQFDCMTLPRDLVAGHMCSALPHGLHCNERCMPPWQWSLPRAQAMGAGPGHRQCANVPISETNQ